MSTTRRCSDWSSVPEPGAQWVADSAGVCFSDPFNVAPQVPEDRGALGILVVSDLPIFADPFLKPASAEANFSTAQRFSR